MLKKRIIPIVLLKNGYIVQSKQFKKYRNIGNPVTTVLRLSEWGADELIYIDISNTHNYDLNRDDLNTNNHSDILSIFSDVAKHTNMPTTLGGKIRSIEDIEQRLSNGADKVCLNYVLHRDPDLMSEAARIFGSQCIVASIDYRRMNEEITCYFNNARETASESLIECAKRAESIGAGELLINAVDRDGKQTGYDLEATQAVKEAVTVPVITCGGVGKWEHFFDALTQTDVDAVAAANIFHFYDQSVYLAKSYLWEHDLPVRKPQLIQWDHQHD